MIMIPVMPRPRSEKVHALKAKLVARISDGFHAPGQRFLSARAVATRFSVSYQTAHRVISELESEGLLQRRASSGTFIAGQRKALSRVELFFHPRARLKGSFGARLLTLLRDELKRRDIPHRLSRSTGTAVPAAGVYPVIWELPDLVQHLRDVRRGALLLNQLPRPGIEASLIDAVSTDDYSAGICATEVLRERLPADARFAVLAGPADDLRSRRRVEGFLSCLPQAAVISAGSWYCEEAAAVAGDVMALAPQGVFCVNDRLAEAMLRHCAKAGLRPPFVVGHDNAPVAEEWNLTTIGTPWEEMVATALAIIRLRLEGHSGSAQHILIAQRPVRRLTA